MARVTTKAPIWTRASTPKHRLFVEELKRDTKHKQSYMNPEILTYFKW